MRLSEAIMLGRHLVTDPQPYEINSCALGMALRAMGLPFAEIWMLGYAHAVIWWPWLEMPAASEGIMPCGCSADDRHNTHMKVLMHLFDGHVVPEDPEAKRMTLEQLVDWVRSVEPEEEQQTQRSAVSGQRTENLREAVCV